MLKILLFPFTILYTSITSIRNYFFDKNILKSTSFDLPIINVGNLSVGGTGKTPHVEYLIRVLKSSYKIATLSRGYGRKTKGFILASEAVTAGDIGDEPFQFYQKFTTEVKVSVGESRAEAVPYLLQEQPQVQLIILDDAFQHRYIRPSLNILLTDYSRLFFKDLVLPSGRLRERRTGARRADIIIVSKCPTSLSSLEKQSIKTKIRKYSKAEASIFFSSIRYSEIVAFYNQKMTFSKPNTSVLLVTGIAQTQSLESYIRSEFASFEHLKFPDHHHYTLKDIEKIKKTFEAWDSPEKIIICTEKDFVKLKHFQSELEKLPVFYLPIEVCFLEAQSVFDREIKQHIVDFLEG